MKQIKLSKRLSTASQYVRGGAIVADVGTDHAYIPIYLTQQNKVKFAIASDINEGPISRARENISSLSLDDKITTYVANGLDGIEKYSPTDIVICGMGGELIAEIIDKCEYVKNKNINLILQPMTSILELRNYLKNGFDIIDEDMVFEDGKYYQIICATYDAQNHIFSNAELELGKVNIAKKTKTFNEYLEFLINKKRKIKNGLLKGGCDIVAIEKEIEELEKLK